MSARAASGVRLRDARVEDAAAIARVMRAAIRGLARAAVPPAALAAWSSLPALYHAWAMGPGGEEYAIAVRGSRIVAYAARRGREITAAFVLPREARRGLGAMLLARLEARARREGARSVFVRAAPGALAFYEAAGYRPGAPIRVPLPGGAALLATRAEKQLRRAGHARSHGGAQLD